MFHKKIAFDNYDPIRPDSWMFSAFKKQQEQHVMKYFKKYYDKKVLLTMKNTETNNHKQQTTFTACITTKYKFRN